MRIDKFLWSTRYFKTRNQATQACRKGKVRVNEQVVKPAREVFPTDMISVRKNQIEYRLMVLDLPKSRVGAKLVDVYRKDTTPNEVFERAELLRHAKDHYRKKGTGRPTKKDRRDIEEYKASPDPSLDDNDGQASEEGESKSKDNDGASA